MVVLSAASGRIGPESGAEVHATPAARMPKPPRPAGLSLRRGGPPMARRSSDGAAVLPDGATVFLMMSGALSAIMTTGELVLPDVMVGMIEESATRRL